LHILLHDCGTRTEPSLPEKGKMTEEEMEFARYAESNDIVLLMPRLTSGDFGRHTVDVNRGCWDVFG